MLADGAPGSRQKKAMNIMRSKLSSAVRIVHDSGVNHSTRMSNYL